MKLTSFYVLSFEKLSKLCVERAQSNQVHCLTLFLTTRHDTRRDARHVLFLGSFLLIQLLSNPSLNNFHANIISFFHKKKKER